MSEPWIEVLRSAVAQSSQTRVARKIGYSNSVISYVLAGTYTGDLKRVQAAVEGALMNAQVECPILGLISRAKCVEIQRRPFTPTNPLNVQLYRACRSGCAHSFLQPTESIGPSADQPAVSNNSGSTGVAPPFSRDVTVPTRRRKRPSSSQRRKTP